MTVVAALVTRDGCWMGADSLASDNDLRADSSAPKVFAYPNFLMGFAGSYGPVQAFAQELRRDPGLTVRRVARDFAPPGRDCFLLFADPQGVYEFTPDGGLIKMKPRRGVSYGAVGTGTGPALGSLFSWHDGRESLLSALAAAEAHTNRVRRPFRVVSL